MSLSEATETAQGKPRHETVASGTKLKTVQHKPRHESEATTQQQHLVTLSQPKCHKKTLNVTKPKFHKA